MFLIQLAAVALIAVTPSSSLNGQYVEVRTCDIWTAPCFANAEINLAGKHAVMAWKVSDGAFENVNLKGLGIVAVIAAQDTLGQAQTGPTRAILFVDEKANTTQREALVRLAKNQTGELLKDVSRIHVAPLELTVCDCEGGACARMKAGNAAHLETRCLDTEHDKACGNEGAYYPPLAKLSKAHAAVAVEHAYHGRDFDQTWRENDRRGAYVGTFEIR
jgi:hypothetical protein